MYMERANFMLAYETEQRRVDLGEVHHLLIDIQPMNPGKSRTFLSLVLKQQSIKVVKPSSVSPLLVKRKAYVLFSSKCKYGVRCRLHFLCHVMVN